MTETQPLLDVLRRTASEEGFTLCGVTPAVDSPGFPHLVHWIEAGFAGAMSYFADRKEAYRNPSAVLPGSRSIIVLAYPYNAAEHRAVAIGEGKVARYVWDHIDYHDIIHPKLKRLCGIIRAAQPEAQARGIVDTAPLMEREVAELAGLGWRGKNTLLLNKTLGSYFFLACVLTNLELPIDAPHHASHCGTCTACLQACPTGAFPQPGVLDATRCISYLTIEHRDSIPLGLREGIGHWVFGCDLCQEVCPWNRKPSRQGHRPPDPLDRLDLGQLFDLDDDAFRARFRKTPLWRARRRGVLRNAAIVLGNQADATFVPVLSKGLNDREPVVRGASAWALGRIGDRPSIQALQSRRHIETDGEVRDEIAAALAATP